MTRWNTVRKVVCLRCKEEFETKAHNQKRCVNCQADHHKEYWQKYRDENINSGVGSGNAQGFGKDHHTFKSGIGIFRRIKLDSISVFNCEKCGKDLSQLIPDKKNGRYFWCVHHIDGNRENNELYNLQLLCKRCRQLEHNCISNLPN